MNYWCGFWQKTKGPSDERTQLSKAESHVWGLIHFFESDGVDQDSEAVRSSRARKNLHASSLLISQGYCLAAGGGTAKQSHDRLRQEVSLHH